MTMAATGLPDRFTTPLYTVTEAARCLDVPASTLATWTHGYRRNAPGRPEVVGAPILTAVPRAADRGPCSCMRCRQPAWGASSCDATGSRSWSTLTRGPSRPSRSAYGAPARSRRSTSHLQRPTARRQQ